MWRLVHYFVNVATKEFERYVSSDIRLVQWLVE